MYKRYGSGTHRTYKDKEQPKLIQIIPLPKELSVQALYKEAGAIKAEQIFLLGLYDTGQTAFLSPDPNGVLDDASVFSNFIRFEYTMLRKN